MVKLAILAGILAGAGCSGFQVRSGGPLGPVPTPEGEGPLPGTPGVDGPAGPVTGASPGTSRRTVCRSTPLPRGWVAVDYVPGGQMCGSTPTEPYSAVVAQALAPLPEGTVLVVCSGQSIPSEWRREPADEVLDSTGQCPRNPGDTREGPTVMRIVRMR